MLICVAPFSTTIPNLFEPLALKSMPPEPFGMALTLEPFARDPV